MSGSEVRGWPMLCAGDHVRLVSPASYPDEEWLAKSKAILAGWGLVVEVGEHARNRFGYMAGCDADRVNDLNDAYRDPAVRAIVTTRGGAGAYRIADRIDFDAVLADPKPLIGFSDITYLHLAVWDRCRVASIHGALAGANAQATVRQLLMSDTPLVVHRDPTTTTAAIEVSGSAEGVIVGGSLTAVAGSVGVSLPSLDGAILFLEHERTIGLGQVDRALTHLLRSGMLSGLRGVALGLFTGYDGYVDRDWTIIDVLRDRLGSLGVPVLGGLKCGHGGVGVDGGPDQFAIPLGAIATMDTESGTLTCQPCAH
jgi:muramoyltetrapeptide carboxypeptidase